MEGGRGMGRSSGLTHQVQGTLLPGECYHYVHLKCTSKIKTFLKSRFCNTDHPRLFPKFEYEI